ncbi:bromodomain and PHD finger containing, 3 [Pisolithus croceorrhizus]|nr:bromodomain and PHD finger containing, 3 [Pisolithus croceorrhizus]
MDRLEKEYFDLTKNIPKPDYAMPCEDSICAVRDNPEGENSNAIVFSDDCNLAVHQGCYGVPYIPEGQWFCRKCTSSPENPDCCIFCLDEGRTFKQTVLEE